MAPIAPATNAPSTKALYPEIPFGISTPPTMAEIDQLNELFETWEAEEIVAWAVETYGSGLVSLSSFGASSGAILHLLSKITHSVPVVFLQTHFHFEETLALRDTIADQYGLTVENWEVWGGRKRFERLWGADLQQRETLDGVQIPEAATSSAPATGIDLCCWLNKVEPLQRALKHRDAYITSIRRDGGTELRARTKILEAHLPEGRTTPIVKINPMANWTKSKLWRYIYDNTIPVHDLFQYGYKSIGCEPCTRAIGEGEDERAGRWGGTKDECGIHTDKAMDFSI
ncbi:MAG: phosphoadenylyl-sulfate reductase [Sumerlaeia bacterium]